MNRKGLGGGVLVDSVFPAIDVRPVRKKIYRMSGAAVRLSMCLPGPRTLRIRCA